MKYTKLFLNFSAEPYVFQDSESGGGGRTTSTKLSIQTVRSFSSGPYDISFRFWYEILTKLTVLNILSSSLVSLTAGISMSLE